MKRLLSIAAASAVVLLAAACTVTGSDGVAVTVTPANFVDVVKAKIKQDCPKVQDVLIVTEALTPMAAATINQASAGQTALDVQKAVAAACASATAAVAKPAG